MKTEIKHTPGPWRYCSGNIVKSDSGVVSESVYPTMPNEANARLIATAPELLKVVKHFAEYLRVVGHHEKLRGEVNSVISKSEGK